MGGTRALLGLVIGLGVLIVAGFSLVVATLAHRALGPGAEAAPVSATLGEPAGTRVSGFFSSGDRLGLLLDGGAAGARLVLLDAHDGRRVGTIAISGPAAAPSVPSR